MPRTSTPANKTRSSFRHSRPAPRNAAGPPRAIHDDVTWTRNIEPRERYRILYRGSDGITDERTIELQKLGNAGEHRYLGVLHEGRFKTLRADRIVDVLQQLPSSNDGLGHPPSIVRYPQYADTLPHFPVGPEGAIFRVPTMAAFSNRSWTVDLGKYTCTCPERRIRGAKGYQPGQLGHVCPHLARAIVEHLPADAPPEWTAELRGFLSDSRKVHIDNLTANDAR